MIKFTIGSNNTTKKLERRKALRIISKYTKGYTYHLEDGCFEGVPEKSMVVAVGNMRSRIADKVGKELAKDLKQKSVMIENIKTSIKFVS